PARRRFRVAKQKDLLRRPPIRGALKGLAASTHHWQVEGESAPRGLEERPSHGGLYIGREMGLHLSSAFRLGCQSGTSAWLEKRGRREPRPDDAARNHRSNADRPPPEDARQPGLPSVAARAPGATEAGGQ